MVEILKALFTSMQLIGMSSGAWFISKSEIRQQSNGSSSVLVNSDILIRGSSVVQCALRCSVGNSSCKSAATRKISDTQYCSLMSQEEDLDSIAESNVQVYQYKDLDECTVGMSNCHETAICTNTIASFTCSCPAGHVGNGITGCVNIDECTTGTSACHSKANCTDTQGSYTCQCQAGFEGDGFACENINECTRGPCSSYGGNCIDQHGSFSCSCKDGFTGNGYICRAHLGIRFDSLASPVPHSSKLVDRHNEMTVCLWVKYKAAGIIATVWNDLNQRQCVSVSMTVSSSLSSIDVEGPSFALKSVATKEDVWNHICLTRSGSWQSLYVNRTESSSVAGKYPDIPQSNLHISLGKPDLSDTEDSDKDRCPAQAVLNEFLGEIKDVFFWIRRISSDEIKRVYYGSSIPTSHMKIEWPRSFEEKYPERMKVKYTLQQLTDIHGSE